MVVTKMKKIIAVMIKRVEPLLIQGLNAFIKAILVTLKEIVLEHRASCFCYEESFAVK